MVNEHRRNMVTTTEALALHARSRRCLYGVLLAWAVLVTAPAAMAQPAGLERCQGRYSGRFDGGLIADASGGLSEFPDGTLVFSMGWQNVTQGAEIGVAGGSAMVIADDGTMSMDRSGGFVVQFFFGGAFDVDSCSASGTYAFFNAPISGTWTLACTECAADPGADAGGGSADGPDDTTPDDNEAVCVEQPLQAPWANAAGGDFSSSSNWLLGDAPRLDEAATFVERSADGATVTFSTDVVNAALIVRDDTVGFNLNGFAYTLTEVGNCRPGIDVGFASNAVHGFSVTDGLINAGSVTVAPQAGMFGSIAVNPTGDLLSRTLTIIGETGNGELSVADGGSLQTSEATLGLGADADGQATVAGFWRVDANGALEIGFEGSGLVSIEDGGQLNLEGDAPLELGVRAGSIGELTISGSDSVLDANRLSVGRGGSGTLSLTASSAAGTDTAAARTLTLGEAVTGNGVVEVRGSGLNTRLAVDEAAVVGQAGDGTLRVSDAATFLADTLTLAAEGSSAAVLDVAGPGSGVSVSRFTVIAESGTASMNIRDGALVTAGLDTDSDLNASSIAVNEWVRGSTLHI